MRQGVVVDRPDGTGKEVVKTFVENLAETCDPGVLDRAARKKKVTGSEKVAKPGFRAMLSWLVGDPLTLDGNIFPQMDFDFGAEDVRFRTIPCDHGGFRDQSLEPAHRLFVDVSRRRAGKPPTLSEWDWVWGSWFVVWDCE